VSAQDTLLVFADASGAPGAWRLLSGGAVVGRGDALAELPETRAWVRTVLAVPGHQVSFHWVELADSLTPVQAAAAARLQIAEETPEPIDDLFVAAGRAERGLTAIAHVPAARMQNWLETAQREGVDPDVVLPTTMLLQPPGSGLACYRGGEVPDYRGLAQAFAVEEEIASLLVGDAPVAEVDEGMREAGLAPALASPAINLRQGAFARRRPWTVDWGRARWLTALAATLLLVSLAHQMTVILRTTFAADRYEAEAAEARRALGGPRQRAGTAFTPVAAALFGAIGDTPNAELAQIVYSPDGALRASLFADSPATLTMLQQRIEARGVSAQASAPASVNGRTGGQIIVRRR
jgi:general secretion pathway protein L